MSMDRLSLNEEELGQLEELAKQFFSLDELELIMQLPRKSLILEMQMERSEVADAINRGRLLTEAELRAAIIEAAKNGRSPAQNLAVDLLQKMKMNDAAD